WSRAGELLEGAEGGLRLRVEGQKAGRRAEAAVGDLGSRVAPLVPDHAAQPPAAVLFEQQRVRLAQHVRLACGAPVQALVGRIGSVSELGDPDLCGLVYVIPHSTTEIVPLGCGESVLIGMWWLE